VQRAFQDALEQSAMAGVLFDTALIETLLEHGADAGSVFLQGLFNVTGDLFKYCEAIRQGDWDPERRQNLFNRLRLAFGSELQVSRRTTSPWLEPQIGLLNWLVEGFDDYVSALRHCAVELQPSTKLMLFSSS
jgi:hypothetical protein